MPSEIDLIKQRVTFDKPLIGVHNPTGYSIFVTVRFLGMTHALEYNVTRGKPCGADFDHHWYKAVDQAKTELAQEVLSFNQVVNGILGGCDDG